MNNNLALYHWPHAQNLRSVNIAKHTVTKLTYSNIQKQRS